MVSGFCGVQEHLVTSQAVRVESKTDMKEALRRSPDHADSIAVLVETAMSRGLVRGMGSRTGAKSASYRRAKDREAALHDEGVARRVMERSQSGW